MRLDENSCSISSCTDTEDRFIVTVGRPDHSSLSLNVSMQNCSLITVSLQCMQYHSTLPEGELLVGLGSLVFLNGH